MVKRPVGNSEPVQHWRRVGVADHNCRVISDGTHRRMLDQLIRSNAVDKRWVEGLIAGAATLEDMERAAIGTADNRWRIPRFNGRAVVDEARHMARI